MITPGNPNDITINDKFIPTASQLAAQLTLSGGGVVSRSGTHVERGGRVYVSSVSKPELATERIYYIDCPRSGTVITRCASTGTSLVTVTNNGIPLSAWDALYWFIPTQPAEAAGASLNFIIIHKDNTTLRHAGRNFMLAVNNPDTGLKWMAGQMTIPKDSGLPATYNTNTGHVSWLPTIGSIPTSVLTSGSLIGYLTSGSLVGYVTTGSTPTNYLRSGSITPITSLGSDTAGCGYRLLNPSNQYQTRALRGAGYIDIVVIHTFLTVQTNAALSSALKGKQSSLIVTGNDPQNNFRLLDDVGNVRSMQAGDYLQLVRDNTTLMITASNALLTVLNG